MKVFGHEVLVAEGTGPIDWGCYPMAPWAGRTRDGEFEFDGRHHQLRLNAPPHAMHGTVFYRPWTVLEPPTTFECDLGPAWPFPGVVRQEVVLDEDRLRLRLEVHAEDEPMPAAAGWHPWFRRSIGEATARLEFDPGYMLEKDAESIPTGRKVTPGPGPWDDCFGDLRGPPRIIWGDILDLSIETICPFLVVYDETAHAICVEPQSAPPDSLNSGPDVVVAGAPLVAATVWRWARPRP